MYGGLTQHRRPLLKCLAVHCRRSRQEIKFLQAVNEDEDEVIGEAELTEEIAGRPRRTW